MNECHTNKLFFNKIWQATKYTIQLHEKADLNPSHLPKELKANALTEMDRWILSRLGGTVLQFNQAMNEYNFHLATAALKSFFYTNFCDVYLETTKPRNTDLPICCSILKTCLTNGLEMMKHFTPFLAAELLQHLPTDINFDVGHKITLDGIVPEIYVILNLIYFSRKRGLILRWNEKRKIFLQFVRQ